MKREAQETLKYAREAQDESGFHISTTYQAKVQVSAVSEDQTEKTA
jgi:hypothetical protein